MLQELLNLGLVDIGSEDSRFEKMKAAGTALVEKLKTEPSLLVPATLIAIDNDVDENEPFFSLVEELVIAEWKTMRNTHVNRPRELLRSIIIHALSQATQGSPEAAGVLWQTAISPFNHRQTRFGKEASLVEDLLHRVGEMVEREAVTRAGMAKPVTRKRQRNKSAPQATFELQPFSALEDQELTNDVARAVGPEYPQGKALPKPNPHWPNSHQPWAYEFTPRMTAAVVKAVNLGIARLSESLAGSIAQYLTALDQQATDHLRSVETIQAEVFEAQQAGKMRLDVLWWLESRFSPSLMCGYRELPQAACALAMVYDLTQLVPALAPASVTYVLGEAMEAVLPPEFRTKQHSIKDLLTSLVEEGSKVKKLYSDRSSRPGRVPLLELVSEAASGNRAVLEESRTRTGVEPSLEVTMQEFAMWVFRDQQARRLAEEIG